eukprot:1339109-Pyramimonas_sp.AAC.1
MLHYHRDLLNDASPVELLVPHEISSDSGDDGYAKTNVLAKGVASDSGKASAPTVPIEYGVADYRPRGRVC